MLCAFLTVLCVMVSDILYALKAERSARRYIALAIVFGVMGVAMIKGWI